MSPHAYSEDQLVEQPAVGLFAELGWATVSAMEEVFGPGVAGNDAEGRVRKGAPAGSDREFHAKKWPQKALQGRLQLAPSVPLRVKLGATCSRARLETSGEP